MKTYVLKSVLSIMLFVGLMSFIDAQTKNHTPKVKQEQLIAFELSELIEYPQDAIFNESEGIVYVRFVTDESNNISNVRVLGKSNKDLSEAVIEAVYKLNRNSVMTANNIYRIPVSFEIKN